MGVATCNLHAPAKPLVVTGYLYHCHYLHIITIIMITTTRFGGNK